MANGMENDSFLYFGYASNLKRSLLEERIGDFPLSAEVGVLQGFGFRFNRENPDGSARANIIFSESEQVYGVVYKIDSKHYDQLMSTEPGYELIEVSVKISDALVIAQTFIARDHTSAIYPSAEYLQVILDGAREFELPGSYCENILALATKNS